MTHSTMARTLTLPALLLALVGCASTPVAAPPPAVLPVVAAVPLPLPSQELAAPAPFLRPLAIDLGPAASAASDPPKPSLDAMGDPATVDADAIAQRADLWQRVRGGFAMPNLDNDLVRKWEQWYASRPDYVQRMTERGGRYLFHIVEEVEKRGMPTELALLPFIESAFNPQALSGARASGMWQFMPATGKDFELTQNLFRDDRRDVLASTRAALDYLQSLHRMFGDWQHALAAYNWGQGNVQRALARNRKAGLAVDYESLRMPDETRNYLPKLQAVKHLVLQPDAFGLTLPALENHPYFLSVAIERDIDVALAARLAGLSLDDFQQLNPQMNKPVILAAGTPQLLLPFDNANHFMRQLRQHRGPLATWTAWVAPKTVKPADVARSVGMTEAQLREVNRIPPRMAVKAGSTLLVPRGAHSLHDVSEHVAETAAILFAPESVAGRKRTVQARAKGESVAALAKRYGVPAAQLARWNGVASSATFRGGQAVVLVLPPARNARLAAKPAPAKRSARQAPSSRVCVAER